MQNAEGSQSAFCLLHSALRMISKILVPNRGEIAVRVARACREMGITSVLGHADADLVPFVRRFFDEAVAIGPGYLDVGKIIDAARSCGADALHPGHAFPPKRPESPPP